MKKLKLIGAVLISAGLIGLIENILVDNRNNKKLEYQIWVLPCDCAKGETNGEIINGFTRMEDCYGGYFTVFEDYTLVLPKNVLPTLDDYHRLLERTKSENIKLVYNNLPY